MTEGVVAKILLDHEEYENLLEYKKKYESLKNKSVSESQSGGGGSRDLVGNILDKLDEKYVQKSDYQVGSGSKITEIVQCVVDNLEEKYRLPLKIDPSIPIEEKIMKTISKPTPEPNTKSQTSTSTDKNSDWFYLGFA
jgi:hypothetical protein